jgi:hypothetical protein
VALLDGLARKYPRAPWEWPWQGAFRATRHYVDRFTATALVAIGRAPNGDRRTVLRERLAFILERAG